MKTIKLFFYICLPVILLSNWHCSNSNNSHLFNYHKALNYISDSTLYHHFPEDDLIRKINVSIPCVNGSGLEIDIFLEFEKNEIENFINEHQMLDKYSINDSCTNYYLNKNDSLLARDHNCIWKNPPVPNYNFWLSPNETMFDYEDIKNDLTYFVIESESGRYLPDSLLTKSFTPPYEYVYNGFSRGYAVSENANLIVYWLIIW